MAVRRVNIVDKHLLEVANVPVDQEEYEDEDEDDYEGSRLERCDYGFHWQVQRWNLAC